MIHAITTGYVKITRKWVAGEGKGIRRMLNTVLDSEYTDWLPIWCFVIEGEDGLTVIDTGIPENANTPIYFPPHMRLIQRAARFRINKTEEIGFQMRAKGLNPDDVRRVILTHLHQDHEGGLHHFPNAEFFVSRAELKAAQGFTGRMSGYQNQRWPRFFKPTLVDFTHGAVGSFPESQCITDNITLVPTPGHSAGHMSVILRQGELNFIFAGDVAYTEAALWNTQLDGVSGDLAAAEESMHRMQAYMRSNQSVFLPSHDPDVPQRLENAQTGTKAFLPR